MIDIDAFMKQFCDLGAASMRRYAELSGEMPDAAPEYFMSSYILDHVGLPGRIGGSLETHYSKLIARNSELRGGLPHGSEPVVAAPSHVQKKLVDMVLLVDSPAQQQVQFLALVEVKPGEFTKDRDKLMQILQYIDMCPYGITCGHKRDLPGLEYWRDKVKTVTPDDRWFDSGPLLPDGRMFFCARLFRNPFSK